MVQHRSAGGMAASPNRPAAAQHGPAEDVRLFAAGATIYRQGEATESLYLLLAGRVRLTSRGAKGPPLVTGLLKPGAIFGLDSLAQTSHSETASTETATAVRVVPVTMLDRLFSQRRSQTPGLVVSLMEAMVRRRAAAERLFARALVADVPGRLAGALLDAADGRIVSGLSRRELAEAAWTTRETATRVLFRFQTAGMVRVEGRRIELLDVAGLSRLAAGDRRPFAA